MNKGTFSGTRRNSRSVIEQGLSYDGFAYVPVGDDPESLRQFYPGFKPPTSRHKPVGATLSRKYVGYLLGSPLTFITQASNFGNTSIQSIAYGNNVWVAAGNSGQLRTSTDAVTWTTQTSNFGASQIFRIAFGNSLWVAGGVTGQLRTSTDAITWTTRTSNFGITNIRTVVYGNSLWVAVGYTGQIRTSINNQSIRGYSFTNTIGYVLP